MTKSAQTINRIFLIFGIFCLIFYLIEGIAVRFGQSLLFLWLLLGLFCIGRFFLWRSAWAKGKAAPLPRWMLTVLRVAAVCFIGVFLFVESRIFAAAFRKPPEDLDAVVVLGALVREDGTPSGSLRERIDAAYEFLSGDPDMVCIASGGQGENEPMSEAECIRSELVRRGIEPERIRLEDRSTNTGENLVNSFALLPDTALRVGIVTNDFHVYRALALGRSLSELELFGVPARSTVFGFIHYSMREFFAVAAYYVRGDLPSLSP